MGLFRSPIGIIFGILSSLVMILVVLVLITGVLAFTGGPGPCTPGGGAIDVSDAQAASFDQKWDQMNAALDGGQPSASITITESEATSRADRFTRDNAGDVKDIRVCIHTGYGEVSGKVDLPVTSAKFKAKGTVDLTGQHPKAHFDDISVGNVPGVVLSPFESAVEDAIQKLLDDADLKHKLTVELKEGQAVITGTP